jgi:hypothetical protein
MTVGYTTQPMRPACAGLWEAGTHEPAPRWRCDEHGRSQPTRRCCPKPSLSAARRPLRSARRSKTV